MKASLTTTLSVILFTASLAQAEDGQIKPMPQAGAPAPVATPAPKANPPQDMELVNVQRHEYVPDRHEWHFGGFAGLNLGGNVDMSNGTFTASGETIDTASLSYKSDPSAVIGIEAVYRAPYAWGANFGLSVDSKRAFRDPKFSSIGGSALTAVTDGKMSVSTIYVNGLYQWEHWYVPFGLNVSRVTVENPSVALTDLKGGLGGQIGVGYLFNEHFAIEALARAVGLDSAGDQTVGSATLDVKSGELTDLQITAKGYF